MNKTEKLVEIARSFSYKLNIGNYQSADFFCSEKAEVPESEAKMKSSELYAFCKSEVQNAIREFQQDIDFLKPKKSKNEELSNLKTRHKELKEQSFDARDFETVSGNY